MGLELRCQNGIKHAELGDGVVEVKCRSRYCGHQSGTVVIHQFSTLTGSLLGTKRFRDPAFRREGDNDGSIRDSSVRTA